jgi:hypothetical protein
MDEPIQRLITQTINAQRDWLSLGFAKAKVISDTRVRRNLRAYGFEWAIHTALASFLLENPTLNLLENMETARITDIRVGEIETIAIGEVEKKYKYDLSFKINDERVIIELNTIQGKEASFIQSDVKKHFPPDSKQYFLVVKYPCDRDGAPNVTGATEIHLEVESISDFRFFLFKKNPS